jgi:hypothetical protein
MHSGQDSRPPSHFQLSAMEPQRQKIVTLGNHRAVNNRMRSRSVVSFGLSYLLILSSHAATTLNGFIIDEPLVPKDEIRSGGVPRDGIPAITRPQFVTASRADFLEPGDRVLGLSRNGFNRAYPIKILNFHEIVNDDLGEAIVITFCPLCGTGIAFRRDIGGAQYTFGVSGLLYNSDVLMYDHQTDSLWSQIASRAVSGNLKGAELEAVPIAHTTWEDWRERHPDTQVLSIDTGFNRNYYHSPYSAYLQSSQIMFPVSNTDDRLPAKELIIGLEIDGLYKAYPLSALPQHENRLGDRHAEIEVFVEYDHAAGTGRIVNAHGEEIPTFLAFWFAWAAFHPQTDLFEP